MRNKVMKFLKWFTMFNLVGGLVLFVVEFIIAYLNSQENESYFSE